MVNKLDLNNEIISLRKQFGKAKNRTISKVARKMKTLEHGKKINPKNEKLDKKLAKINEELQLLKKSTKLEMVKTTFAFNEDPNKVLKLFQATPEQRAICRLLMNDFLRTQISDIKKKLDLKPEDQEWQKMLFEMGKNKKQKLKKENAEKKETDDVKNNSQKKGKPNKSDKLLKTNDSSKAIDKNKKKQKFDQKRKQFMKSSGQKGKFNKSQDVTVKTPKDINKSPKVKKDFSDKTPKDRRSPKNKPEKSNDKPKNNEKLHPSWQAKKQNKPAISKFEGKKIKFD